MVRTKGRLRQRSHNRKSRYRSDSHVLIRIIHESRMKDIYFTYTRSLKKSTLKNVLNGKKQ